MARVVAGNRVPQMTTTAAVPPPSAPPPPRPPGSAPKLAVKRMTMGRLARRNLRAKPSRFIATMLAVLVGTGFLAGALVLKDSIGSSLESNAVQLVQNVDAAVVPKQLESLQGGGGGPPTAQSGVPYAELATVQKASGVAGAAGAMTGSVEILNGVNQPVRAGSLGRLWIPVPELNPFTVVSGQAPANAGEIAVDRETADQAGLQVGSAVSLRTTSGAAQARVVGITSFGDDASANVSGDLFTSQADAASYLNEGVAAYDSIYVHASPGATNEVMSSVQQAVGDGFDVIDGATLRKQQQGAAGEFAGFIGTGLQIFAYVSLFVCLFIIYNTFSIIVAQRLREFALLRAIGADTRQIRKSVRREALLIGVLASFAGLVLGIVLFLLLLRLVPAFKGLTGGGAVKLRVSLATVIQVMGLGVLITFFSAVVPSFRAGRTPPIAALQSVSIDRSGANRFRMIAGPVLIVVGAALLVLGVQTGSLLLAVPGPVLMFLGVLIGGPRLAVWFSAAVGFVVRPIARRVGKLAVENVERNPTRTATTANALVIGVFLVVFVTAAGGAIRDYASDQLGQFAGPDLTVGVRQGALPANLVQQVQDLPDVTSTVPIYPTVGDVGQQFASATDFTKLDTAGFKLSGPAGPTNGNLSGLRDDQVVVWSFIAPSQGLTIGSPVTVTLANGKTLDLTVGALVDPVFTVPGAFIVSSNAVLAADPNLQPGQLAVQTKPGTQQQVQQQVEDLAASYTSVSVAPGDIFSQLIKSVFTALIQSVNALLGVAVVIALFGIVNTLILSVTERTREIGVLRAVGMSRAQLRATIRIEAVIVALLGTVVGLVFGLFVAYMATRPIFAEGTSSFPWPVGSLVLIVLLGLVLGVVASLIPAWRASRLNILDAITVE